MELGEEIAQTLRSINYRLQHLETTAESTQDVIETAAAHGIEVERREDEAETSRLEKQLSFLQKWGWVLAAVGFVFTAGVTWAVWGGANATDDEVDAEVHRAIVKHNGYVDPDSVDPVTHRPLGEHPDLRAAIQENTKATSKLSDVTTELAKTQEQLDLRSKYQYEYTKWEVRKSECSRKRNCTRKDLDKPKSLEDLESELINN